MKKFNNKIFTNVFEPESFIELLELIIVPALPENGIVRMWRGQSNIEWKIDSSAYRRIYKSKGKVSENDLIHYETTLLKHAKHKDYHVSKGRIINDLELLALLQHNGAATRLVDFSRNSLVALWFAISNQMDKTGLLFGAHAYFLGGYEGENKEETYENVIKILPTIQHPITWEPTVVSPRVAAQHSQFLYSDLSNSPIGSLKISNEDDAALYIAINPKLKKESKSILTEAFDIREQTLFPDLSGFSVANNSFKHLNEMHRW